MNSKVVKLKRILNEMNSALLAFSGGVDSTFLARMAQEILRKKLLAVTVSSALFPKEETRKARALARELRLRHRVIALRISERVKRNSLDRCYYCKKQLFSRLIQIAKEEGMTYVLEASNYDDLKDYRPGQKALRSLKVRSPLLEAGLTKREIRRLSKEMGLRNWDKPAFACLATRIPYGQRIMARNLAQVEKAERFLRRRGLRNVRVRLCDECSARIEVEKKKMMDLVQERKAVTAYLQRLGFLYVTMDLDGFQSGSMNRAIRWRKDK
jgi:uncharacterized protein